MAELALLILPYFAVIIGFLIVWILNGIKSEIKEVKNSMLGLEKELRLEQRSLEERVFRLEFSVNNTRNKEQ